MSADTTSVFYQVGQAVKAEIASGNQGLLNTAQTWQGTQTFADVIIATGKTITLTDHVDHGVLYSDASGVLSTKTGFEYDASSDTLTVSNLSVTGTTTSVQTTNLEVKDNFIHVSKGANAGAYDKDSGLYFERAQGSEAQAFIWDESEDRFVLGQLSGGGSTKTVTFTDLDAQIGTAAPGATIDININGALGLTSSFASGGAANDPESFYVFTGNTDSKKVTVDGELRDLPSNISDNLGTGLYVWSIMDPSDGSMNSKYAVFVYVASGDTFADVTKLHVWDDAYGMFVSTNGDYYIDSPDSGTAITSGSATFGSATFTFITTDSTAGVTSDSSAQSFTGSGNLWSASITAAGSTTYTAGTYDVTMVLKGQLASEATEVQISATSGGSPVTDFNGNPVPFGWNTGTLSYIADSADPYTTFQQLAVDASKLGYSPTNTSTNGGYFMASSTDGTQLEVSFDTTPGGSDYIGLAHGSSVVMPVPPSGSADGPDADTATVTPGPLTVGELKLDQQNLGDYADFTAGLNA
jgi:hypothetical protein